MTCIVERNSLVLVLQKLKQIQPPYNSDKYPLENATSKSRLSKYSSSSRLSSRESDDDNAFSRHMTPKQRASWMLTRPDTYSDLPDKPFSKEGRPRPKREISVSFDDHPKVVKRSEEILESFRTMDVKKLAKSILKDKIENTKPEDHGAESSVEETVTGEEKKVFVPGVNVYYSTSK